MNTLLDFTHAFATSGFDHLEAAVCNKTPEEIQAAPDGDSPLFDELDEWLADMPVHSVLASRRDDLGLYFVALEDDIDAVNFKLRWSDHLLS